VLTLWRGFDAAPLEKAASNSARTANQIVKNVLTDLRMDRRQAEVEILKVWQHLIDPTIVAHAQPTGLRNGTLFVAVDHSVWLSEIVRYRSKDILTRLQQSFGPTTIARISFRLQ
jgi:predicted nucleic acid-binding Zn ribbon protein